MSGNGIRRDLCIKSEGQSADERGIVPQGGRQDLRERQQNAHCHHDTREEGAGIIAFITNGAWLDGNAQDGLRKCFSEEFDDIYVFNLRGNCRTSGELRRREGDGVFGLGSRTPIAITVLVKRPRGKQE